LGRSESPSRLLGRAGHPRRELPPGPGCATIRRAREWRCSLLAGLEPDQPPGSLLRHPACITVVLIAIGYGLLALLLPHPAPTFDEAKYLAIGVNALQGHGPRTAFGDLFLPHSPVWPMVFAAPLVAAGVSPWAWGYLLNAVAATCTLLLTGWLSRSFGPRAMLLAVAALVAWLSLFDLARTARLDVPEAALTLAYLALALSAVDSGLARRGILAGVVFALAFLVKEASLIVLGAPFLAAIAQRRPLASTARAGGLVLLTAVPLVAWWFAWYAGQTARVYVLGLGSAWLVPVGGSLLLLGGMLVALGSAGAAATVLAPLEHRLAHRRAALAAAGVLLLGWVAAFLFAFSRSEVQAGRPLLDLPNLARWARLWATDLGPILLVGLGVAGAFWMAARRHDRSLAALVALVAGIPWLLLVAVQGEPPRNDIALFALLASAGAAGWLELPRALAGRDRLMALTGAALGVGILVAADLELARHGVATGATRHRLGYRAAVVLGAVAGGAGASTQGRRLTLEWLRRAGAGRRSPILLRGVAVGLVAALSVGLVGVSVPSMASAATQSNTSALAGEVAAWIEGNLPVGSTVMFGSVLANEEALRLDGRYELRSLQATLATTDPSAPLGVRVGGDPAPDIVALDRHPRQDGYYAFTASAIDRSLRAAQPAAWVYATGIDTSAPSLVPWLATVKGIRQAAVLQSPKGAGQPLEAHIYWVDLATLAIPDARTFVSAAAVGALLDGLAGGAREQAIAAALLTRAVIYDTGPAADAALARLKAAAGQ